MRSPLTVLSGYLEAMEDGSLPPTPARLALMQQEISLVVNTKDALPAIPLDAA
ncbi:MAG: hypothetical protein DHS20C20_21670 [Ardenticatenaceae bacterium]|nr:MAG: hypothetical protein DHS20C20_21670 [Ardenticatenaceae bacterium]